MTADHPGVAARDWLVRIGLVVLSALLTLWWNSDIAAKSTFTRDWKQSVDTHMRTGDAAITEFVAVKQSLPRIEEQLRDMSREIRELRDFMMSERGRQRSYTGRSTTGGGPP